MTSIRVLICVALLAITHEAAAQNERGSAYVTGGLFFPHQASLDAPTAPPFATPGGSTASWLVGGGVFLSPQLSVEAELSRTGVMRASETAGRHDTSEAGTRQDWFVTFALKAHHSLTTNVRVEPVGGLALVGSEATFSSSSSGSSSGYYPLAWRPGVMFGADFRIGGPRFALVPGLRFAFAGTPEGPRCTPGPSGEPSCGAAKKWQYVYPNWTQRPSLALAVSF